MVQSLTYLLKNLQQNPDVVGLKLGLDSLARADGELSNLEKEGVFSIKTNGKVLDLKMFKCSK